MDSGVVRGQSLVITINSKKNHTFSRRCIWKNCRICVIASAVFTFMLECNAGVSQVRFETVRSSAIELTRAAKTLIARCYKSGKNGDPYHKKKRTGRIFANSFPMSLFHQFMTSSVGFGC